MQAVDLFYFQTDIKGTVVENLSKRCGSFLKNIRLENCKWINDDAIKYNSLFYVNFYIKIILFFFFFFRKLCLNCKNIEEINCKQCLKLTDQ